MNKSKLIKNIREGYWPEADGSRQKNELVEAVEKLLALTPNTKEYLTLKCELIEELGRTVIEGYKRGKMGQAGYNELIFNDLTLLLAEKEDQK